MITAGIDAGAATTKAVLLCDREILGYRVADTGFDFSTTARDLYSALVADAGIAPREISGTCATGYGRNLISGATKSVSEITAQARGVAFFFPEVRGIIDVGGQDAKVIVVTDGRVSDFLMNDRCAAGTGKFLEHTARALEVTVGDLAALAMASRQPARISSMCTVFAESEVISLRARGISREDIAAGLIDAIAGRVLVMAGRMGFRSHIAFVGGVAKNAAMRAALEKSLGIALFVPPEPQITAALGAAILAQGPGPSCS